MCLALDDPLFLALDFYAPLAHFLFLRFAKLQQLLAAGNHGPLADILRLTAGLFENARGRFLGRCLRALLGDELRLSTRLASDDEAKDSRDYTQGADERREGEFSHGDLYSTAPARVGS